ncbi:hypothetical protein WMW72_32725 [Paenibacillus filicis]|uniref:Uncharacterized protein n=1 Tax=Paenibacillus filicis TaxID=669464 RepID=A0ABU9DUV1_9BACL
MAAFSPLQTTVKLSIDGTTKETCCDCPIIWMISLVFVLMMTFISQFVSFCMMAVAERFTPATVK